MEEEFELDLHENDLYGWELEKSEDVVAAIEEGIIWRDWFPAVYVQKLGDRRYQLIFDSTDPIRSGGHNRAIGHYRMNEPLTVLLHHGIGAIPHNAHIKDIQLVPDTGQLAAKLQAFPDYRVPDPND